MAARPHDADEPEPVDPGPAVPAHDPGSSDEPLGEDIDSRWQAIVDQLTSDLPTSDLPSPGARPAADVAAGAVPAPAGSPPPRVDPALFRVWTPAEDEDDEHFQPPDPGPVLGGDPVLTLAWAAVIGVPVLLLLAVVAWRNMPAEVLQAAGAAFLIGVGLLLWRMPRDRDGTGPGAVV